MLLKEVSTFAESSISRRKYLLSYFGEKYDPNINDDNEMDDNSKNEKEKINVKDQLLFLLKNHFFNNKKILIREIIKNLPLMKKMGLMKSFGEQLLLIRSLKVFLRKIFPTLRMLKSLILERIYFKSKRILYIKG